MSRTPDQTEHTDREVQRDADRDVDRRTLLRAAGVGGVVVAAVPVLAACGGSSSAGGTPSGPAPGSSLEVPVASVPVGSGVIADGAVVAQPAAGTFLAFDGTCPHQGCVVSAIQGDVVICPCHGSTFSLKDGSVQQGPAQQGLTKRTATVKGDQVVVS